MGKIIQEMSILVGYAEVKGPTLSLCFIHANVVEASSMSIRTA
jgi:hypothetical protein